MKKIVFATLVLFLLSGNVLAASFPDVPEDHKNYEAIEFLDFNEIINGYTDGTFNPDGLVNRAESIKIIVGAIGIDFKGTYEVLFPDVPADQWFFDYVMAAQKAGIVSGYQDGKFRPADSVNLAETLKILFEAADVSLPEVTNDVFVDVPKDAWFAPYIMYARNHNIILADDYGAVHPAQAMTRSAFAEVIFRMMIVLENDGEPFPLHKNWDYYESATMPFRMKFDDQNWKLIEHSDEVIFMKPDTEFLQFSSARIYPNSAIVSVTVDENEQSMVEEQYFSNLKKAFAGATFKEFEFANQPALEILDSLARTVDWYIYLENGQVLAVYTQYGSGVLGFQLQQFIKAMLETLEYKEISAEPKNDYSDLLSEIFDAVLVENKGTSMLDKLPDKEIIKTDTIGVGTGPVDYYYSEELDYTFKYERAGDVILDTREGETTAF